MVKLKAPKIKAPSALKRTVVARQVQRRGPVNIGGLTSEQKMMLKMAPNLGLVLLIERRGDATDWYNVMFRLYVGLELALKHYTEEAVEAMRDGVRACLLVRDRFGASGQQTWRVSPAEAMMMSLAMDAGDRIQDELTRQQQLPAYHNAQQLMALRANHPLLQTTTDPQRSGS